MTTDAHPAVLSTHELSWRAGGVDIINDVSLDLRAGEFLSVIGPNGAGKSSLINLLSGTVRPTRGRIVLNGVDVTKEHRARRAHRGVGRTFQTSSIFSDLTVLENVRLSRQARTGGSLSLVRWPRRRDAATQASLEMLEAVSLHHAANRRAGTLSHGDKRKLEIAVVAVQQPQVLLLDEPTSGASAEEVGVIIDVARRIHGLGNSVLMVEHRIELVAEVSDRVAVMANGSLLMVDQPDVVLADPTVQAAYLGEGL